MYISFELSIGVAVCVYLFGLCLWNLAKSLLFTPFKLHSVVRATLCVFCVHVSSISAGSNEREKINNHRKMYLLPTFRRRVRSFRHYSKNFEPTFCWFTLLYSRYKIVSERCPIKFSHFCHCVCVFVCWLLLLLHCYDLETRVLVSWNAMAYFSSRKKYERKRKKPKMLWNVFIPRSAISFNLHFFQQHLNKISKTGPTCTTNSNFNNLSHPPTAYFINVSPSI